ncbi:MAG: hypothetical protein D6709_02010 [Chloroflexi bacterium]|nr:MAG: hypothetical protein D6709_02010 [Chloroflexota bacterium]
MSRWRVQLLGGFGLWRDETALAHRFETDSARALFAWLCLNAGKPARRDALAALLWPDTSQSAALSALRTTLTRMRRALADTAPALHSDPQTVTLILPADWEVDAALFDQAIAQTRAHTHRRAAGCPDCLARLQQAVAHYAGDLLAGLSVESGLFMDWLAGQREHFHQAALDALETLAERAAMEADWPTALRYSQRQLSLEPWHEPAHRRTMLGLAHQGQRMAALAQYRACRRVLQQEFGADPDPETQRLADAIRLSRWSPAARAPAPGQSRAEALDQLPFIGRGRDLRTLMDLLNQPATRLLSVIGEGGIGKTRLVIRAAQHMRFAFDDGARFIFLHPEDKPAHAPDPAQATSHLAWHIAEACQIGAQGHRSPEAQVLAALKARRHLLVFDSFEHVLEAAGFLGELLEAAPGCAALVASRQRLNLRREQVVRLEGMSLNIEGATGSAGAQLFLALAERNGVVLNAPEARPQIEAICAALHGMPLGIELAAACLSGMGLSALQQAVQQSPGVLSIPIADLPARHRSLQAVFESAWQTLGEAGQQALAALSVLRAPCPPQAAVHLAGSAATLSALVEQSLAHHLADGSLWMHESTRRFAAEKLGAGPDGAMRAQAAQRRHAEWFLRWLAESHSALRSAASADTREQLIASFDDLDAAWRWALAQGEWEWVSAAAFSYETLHRLAGRLADGADRLSHALQIAPPAHDEAACRLRARLLIARDTLQSLRDNQANMEPELREAAALAERIGDRALIILAWSRLARELRDHGKDGARQALDHAQAALQAIEEQPADPDALSAQAEYWRQSGALDFREGRWQPAERHFRTALALARRAQDHLLIPKMMEHLSTVLVARGASAEADALLNEALERYQQLRLTYQQTNVLDLLGQRADAQGHYAQARQHYLKAIELAQASGNRDAEMVTRINLGISCDQMGDYAQALAHTEAALALCRELGGTDHLTVVLANLSLHAHHNGAHDTALHYAREATTLAKHFGIPELEAYGWEFQGHALLAVGQVDAAEAAYRRALEMRQALEQAMLALETRAGLARVALARGDTLDASAWVEPIAAHLLNGHTLDGAEETLRVYWTTYQVLAHNDDRRAEAILRLAAHLIEQRAARLSDAHSQTVYLKVDVHRCILEAWRANSVSHAAATQNLQTGLPQ